MKNRNNEFSKLLSYLEEEEKKGVSKKLAPKKQETKKDKVSSDTKKILADSIENYSDLHTLSQHKSSSTNGFSVEKFESLMRSKLVDNYKKLQSYERPYISVSELYSCMRKNYYYRQRYEIDVKEEFSFSYLYLIQQTGNTIHEVIQNLYDFSEIEKPVVSEKYKVKGRADGIKDEFIYEIKSIDGKKFRGKFFQEHYFQPLIYAYILNHEYNYNIKYVTIVYVQRDLKKIFPFDIPIDNKIAVELLDRSKTLRNCLSSKTVPEPLGARKEECKFCAYKKVCGNDRCEIQQPFKRQKTKKQIKNEVKKEVDKKTAFLI